MKIITLSRATRSGIVVALACALARAGAAETQNIIDQTYGIGAGSFELGVYVPSIEGDFMRLAPGSTTMR